MAFNKLKKGLGKLQEMDSIWKVLQDTLDNNTVNEIRNGKVFVSCQTINEEIAKRISADANAALAEITVASSSDGKLDILAKNKDGKNISLTGTLEKFVYKDGEAKFVYHAENHELTGSLMPSWMFSKLTLGFMQKFIGNEIIPDSIDVALDGNIITVDFSRLLAKSRLGNVTFKGVKVMDLLEIENAVPMDGGIELKTKCNAISTAKEKFVSLLGKNKD